MLTLNDVIYAKDKDGKVTFFEPFDRNYLEYGPKDQTKKRTATVKSTGEANKTIEVTEPVTATTTTKDNAGNDVVVTVGSVEDIDELEAAAINAIQAAYPDVNPRWKILEFASQGFNQEQRKNAAPKRDVPKPPISLDAGIKKMAETLLRTGKVKTMDEALAKVNELMAA